MLSISTILVVISALSLGSSKAAPPRRLSWCDENEYGDMFKAQLKKFGLNRNCTLEEEVYLYLGSDKVELKPKKYIETRFGDVLTKYSDRDLVKRVEDLLEKWKAEHRYVKFGGCYYYPELPNGGRHALGCAFA